MSTPMQLIEYPEQDQWEELAKRPQIVRHQLEDRVKEIMVHVQCEGEGAVKRLTRQIDQVELDTIRVSPEELESAGDQLSDALKSAIQLAKNNIETFHRMQLRSSAIVETTPGVQCWRKQVPISRVGLYIPGGTAPLFSTVLMLGIPARLAGCREIVLCTPPNKEGNVHPAILYTAHLLGITCICKAGGAQAIAAMTFGTRSIPQVDKLFGPGNQYVTKAKEMAVRHGVAIDMPAGPSEVLVITDKTCNPEYVASDLLSQAEHGPDSQVILLGNDRETLDRCLQEVSKQVDELPRREVASQALSHSKALLFDTLGQCMEFSNAYAPEHLIISTENAGTLAEQTINAGSVFLGSYSCESAGDYASGTNHTLPTNGYARNHSGVSVDSFCKTITFQKLSPQGLQNIGPAVEIMAEAEGLIAHKNAVTVRLRDLKTAGK